MRLSYSLLHQRVSSGARRDQEISDPTIPAVATVRGRSDDLGDRVVHSSWVGVGGGYDLVLELMVEDRRGICFRNGGKTTGCAS